MESFQFDAEILAAEHAGELYAEELDAAIDRGSEDTDRDTIRSSRDPSISRRGCHGRWGLSALDAAGEETEFAFGFCESQSTG